MVLDYVHTVFLGKNVIQIAKMQSSVATNLHYLSILFYNKSQKWKILATLGLFWFMHSGCTAGCIQKSVDSSLCLIGLIVFLRSLMVTILLSFWLARIVFRFSLGKNQKLANVLLADHNVRLPNLANVCLANVHLVKVHYLGSEVFW